MASLLSALLTPKAYKKSRKDEESSATAKLLSDIIGGQAQEGSAAYDLSDLAIFEGQDAPSMMTDAVKGQDVSGLYRGASTEQATQLDQLKALAGSGDPTLQSLAMDQYKEFIKPDAALATKAPNSYSEYLLTTPSPTPEGYQAFLMSGKRALGGIGGDSLKLDEIAKLSIRDSQGLMRPVSSPTLTKQDVRNNVGLAPGEEYIVNPSSGERDVQRARDASMIIYEELDNAYFSGPDPIFGDRYDASPEGQLKAGKDWITQDDPRYASTIDFVKGVAGQLARTISGEKGALRDEDIQRVIQGLIPKIAHLDDTFTPVKGDTKTVAKIKMKRLRRMMRLPPKELSNELQKEVAKEEQRYNIRIDGVIHSLTKKELDEL